MVTNLLQSKAEYEQAVAAYYGELADLWQAWGRMSPDADIYHVHYGYMPDPATPYNHTEALEEMVNQLMTRLALSVDTPLTIVDLGCGAGATVVQIAKAFPQHEVIGVTLSPIQAETARQFIAAKNIPNARILVENFQDLSLPNASVDRVFYIESFCHAADRTQALIEAHRILRPGGKIHLNDWFPRSVLQPQSPFYHLAKTMYENYACPFSVQPVDQLIELIEANEFAMDAVEDITANVLPSVKFGVEQPRLLAVPPMSPTSIELAQQTWSATRSLFNLLFNKRFGYYAILAHKHTEDENGLS